MFGYSKSSQIGKVANPKKKNKLGNTISRISEWNKERSKLKLVYDSHRITSCEHVDENGRRCRSTLWLGFAHDKKRGNLEPGELGSFNHTLLLCEQHHMLIENNKQETKRLFTLLRQSRLQDDRVNNVVDEPNSSHGSVKPVFGVVGGRS